MPLFNYYLQTEKEQINLVELLQASKETQKYQIRLKGRRRMTNTI